VVRKALPDRKKKGERGLPEKEKRRVLFFGEGIKKKKKERSSGRHYAQECSKEGPYLKEPLTIALKYRGNGRYVDLTKGVSQRHTSLQLESLRSSRGDVKRGFFTNPPKGP